LTNETVAQIAEKLKELQSLRLRNWKALANESIKLTAQNFKWLESPDSGFCSELTDETIDHIALKLSV